MDTNGGHFEESKFDRLEPPVSSEQRVRQHLPAGVHVEHFDRVQYLPTNRLAWVSAVNVDAVLSKQK